MRRVGSEVPRTTGNPDEVIHKIATWIAIFIRPVFGLQMIEREYPDLSEVAYHIVRLCDFWRNPRFQPRENNLIHVIQKMIEISLGISHAEAVARAVVTEFDYLRKSPRDEEINPAGIEVVFIAALLHEQLDELKVPAATAYWAAVFD